MSKKQKLLFKRDVLKKSICKLIFEQVCDNEGDNYLSEVLIRRSPRLKEGNRQDETYYEYVTSATTKEEKESRIEDLFLKFAKTSEALQAVDNARWQIHQNKDNFFKQGDTYLVEEKVADRLLKMKYKGINFDNSNASNPQDCVYVGSKSHPMLKLELPIVEKVA